MFISTILTHLFVIKYTSLGVLSGLQVAIFFALFVEFSGLIF